MSYNYDIVFDTKEEIVKYRKAKGLNVAEFFQQINQEAFQMEQEEKFKEIIANRPK